MYYRADRLRSLMLAIPLRYQNLNGHSRLATRVFLQYLSSARVIQPVPAYLDSGSHHYFQMFLQSIRAYCMHITPQKKDRAPTFFIKKNRCLPHLKKHCINPTNFQSTIIGFWFLMTSLTIRNRACCRQVFPFTGFMEENCFFRLIDELFPTIFYSADKSLDRMNISHSTFTSAGWKMVEKKDTHYHFLGSQYTHYK